jgi:hypothetical protein
MPTKQHSPCALDAAIENARKAGVSERYIMIHRNRFYQGYTTLPEAVRRIDNETKFIHACLTGQQDRYTAPGDRGSGIFGGTDLSDTPSINVHDHVDPFNVLDEVKATLTERGGEYGDATIEDSFPRIRRYWAAFFKNRFNLDVDLTDADVASLMVLMKTARIDANPTHEDSHKDRIGYAAQAAIKAKG